MQPDSIANDLAVFRIQQAKECLLGAENELRADLYKNAANRSYYCIFNAMRAVLALNRFDSKKHSGIISEFNKSYIKTGLFPIDFSRIIKSAFEIRNNSDYKEFYIVSKEEVATQVENAKIFLVAVEKYLVERIQNS